MSNIIVDCEASSLNEHSFPIQIAWVDLHYNRYDSFYIKPARVWNDWDDYAENSIHGISREFLEEHGLDIHQACKRLTEKISEDDLLYSDAPTYDAFWMNRLMETAFVFEPEWQLKSIFELFDNHNDKVQLGVELEKDIRSHDALDDCFCMKEAYNRTKL